MRTTTLLLTVTSPAAAETLANAQHAQADANRLRDDLQPRIKYLQSKIQEIAA